MRFLTINVLKELSFPEYRARHVFTAKLRLAIFIGFWFLYVIFLKEHLSATKPVTITILASFLLTTICYYNIFNNRFLIGSFALEIVSDLVALTAVVYLTGGPESEYYVIYVFYTLVAGLFYNWRLALLSAVLSFVVYGVFIALCRTDVIPPLLIGEGHFSPIDVKSPYLYPLLLSIFLAMAVYATKIAHYFTQIRERMLEAKNKELLALQQMSSTIRTVTSLRNVLLQVLSGVLEGLDLATCFLLLYDKEQRRFVCIPPDMHPLTEKVEEILGVRLSDIYFGQDAANENAALKQVQQGRIVFRREISEIVAGMSPEPAVLKFRDVQQKLGIQRVIAIPLVTGREVIGALIGFTTEPFVEAKKVNTFQAFADQASLAIEAAMLISELRKKNIALVEANRVKSEFLATMSHELRTPLTAIIGFSELLIEKVMGPVTEDQMDSLREILGNGNNLLEMINNLLDLAKVDSGKMDLNRHTFNWVEMVKRVERSVAPLIQKKNHSLVVAAKGELPLVFADEKRMQQIVLNLLSNAIKFTPENGTICIRTEAFGTFDDLYAAYGRWLGGEASKDMFRKGAIVCSVEDNGIGIAEDDLPAIFDVFQQVDSSVTRSYEGTGLGLALVKQFVELHKGHVWAESSVGKGTKFTFGIPLL